jgi:hypothetical protein
MTTIFPHTVNESAADYNLIPVGTLLLGFVTKNITTKTYSNGIAIVGNSKRQLKDFIEYSSYSDGAILRYYRGKLTTVVPNIYLKDIEGTNISGGGVYLAVTSLGTVINVGRKEYSVAQLSDVADGVSPNKYALTYTTNGISGSWNYFPEASALGRFDDVTFATPSYGVFVSYFEEPRFGGFGLTYRILPLSIVWDRSPILGGALNGNGKAILNSPSFCQSLLATTPVSSLQIDTIQYSAANLVCSDEVKVLALDVVINQEHCKFFTLNLLNFAGILSLTSSQAAICFENGYIGKMKGKDNTYTLLIYKDDVKLKIIVLHKNRNLNVF